VVHVCTPQFLQRVIGKTRSIAERTRYRVIAPDQIASASRRSPMFRTACMFTLTTPGKLLDYLGIKRAIFVAHSLGGMMAARFALMYPDEVERLVLEDPIGLEDYRLKVPFATRDELAAEARKQTRGAIDTFMQGFFANWKPETRATRMCNTAGCSDPSRS